MVIDSLLVILISPEQLFPLQACAVRFSTAGGGEHRPFGFVEERGGHLSVVTGPAVGNYHDNKLGGFLGGLWPGDKCSLLLMDPKKPNLQWQNLSVTGFL